MNRQILVGMVSMALTGCAQTWPVAPPVARSGSRLPPVGLTPLPNIYEALNRENPRFDPASLRPENGPVLANLGVVPVAGGGSRWCPPAGGGKSHALRGLPSRSGRQAARRPGPPGRGCRPAPGESAGPYAWGLAGPGAGFRAGVGPTSRRRTRARSAADARAAAGQAAPALRRSSTAPREPEAEVTQTSAAPAAAGLAPSPEPAAVPEAPPGAPPAAMPLPEPAPLACGRASPATPSPATDGTATRADPGAAPPPATVPPETPPAALPLELELPALPPPEAEVKDPPAALPPPPGGEPTGRRDRLTRSPPPAPAPAPTTGAAAASGAAAKVDPQVVTTSADPAAIHAEGSPVKLTEAGHVAARVGDEVITLNELTEAVKERMGKLPGGYKPNHQEIKMLTSQLLDMLIERSIITQEAKRELKKPEQIKLLYGFADKAWREEELPPLLRQMSVENEFKLKDKLAEQGKSLEQIRDTYRQEFLARGFLEQKLKGRISVTIPEMRDYYNAHIDDFNRHEQWTWREVIVELDKHPTRAAARTKADAVLARLRRGEDFVQVAQAESEGPNRTKGGLWETAPDSYAVPAVNEAIRSLPIGQVSSIIEGPTSYHIVRVDARRPAGPASFAEVQDRIRRLVHRRKVDIESNAFLNRLRKQTVVTTIFDHTDFAPTATRPEATSDPAVTPASGSAR